MPSLKKKKTSAADAYERFQPQNRLALRGWLAANHLVAKGMWLVIVKKGHGHTLSYEEICEELLCVGWVDSRPAALDETRSMLLCTPRNPKAAWSAHNKRRVEALLKNGLMLPKGIELVEAAKASGAWNALDAVDALVVPDDLGQRLASLPPARAHFDAFPRSVKRQLLEWVQTAKKPVTRAARVEAIAVKAQANVRANQWREGPKRSRVAPRRVTSRSTS
jgi:uncharacterized protein YdeI (YjbR/CyaY-like superfamily)